MNEKIILYGDKKGGIQIETSTDEWGDDKGRLIFLGKIPKEFSMVSMEYGSVDEAVWNAQTINENNFNYPINPQGKQLIRDIIEIPEYEAEEERLEERLEEEAAEKVPINQNIKVEQLIKYRFPQEKKLGKQFDINQLSPGSMGGADGIFYENFDGNKQIGISEEFKIGGCNFNDVLTHELVHARRHKKIGINPESDREETATELEASQRGGIIDIAKGTCSGYYTPHGKEWKKKYREDFKIVSGKNHPNEFLGLLPINTDVIFGNVQKNAKKTNLWNTLKFNDNGGENIDTHFFTSEGDYAHFYTPKKKKKVSIKKQARAIDMFDGILGEESVFQLMDSGKKKVILHKKPQKKVKQPKKRKTKIKRSKKVITHPVGYLSKNLIRLLT